MKLICYSALKINFPPVYSQTSISFLRRCSGFLRAKFGDMRAAEAIVKLCVKPWRVSEIKKKYPYAVLLPINGKNKLPLAYAQEIGLKIEGGIRLTAACKKTEIKVNESQSRFVGNIDKGTYYILVGDVFSHDCPASALHKYVLTNGGFVCAVATLAYLERGTEITLEKKHLNGLELSKLFFC